MDIYKIAKEHGNLIVRRSLNLASRPPREDPEYRKVRNLLADTANEYSWANDYCVLERKKYTPVFVYCNVMQGGNRYSVIENIYRKKDDDGLSCNPYVFTREKYAVWQTRDGIHSIPVALPSRAKSTDVGYMTLPEHEREYICRMGQFTPEPFRLKGKLYYLRSDLMKELDKEKQNGILFKRRIVELLNPYRIQPNDPIRKMRSYSTGSSLSDEDVLPIEAWMYVGMPSHWEPHLSSLRSCSLEDHTLRYQRTRPDRPIFASPSKRWDNEPYYFFKAWEVNNL